MKKLLKYTTAIFLVALFVSCETYPDWEESVEYSETYPISGEYYVRDFDAAGDTLLQDWYQLYIYNKSYNPTGDSIWIDNSAGHPVGGAVDYAYKFKIKAKANLVDFTFDCNKQGHVSGSNANPVDSAITVTIENSKIWEMSDDITDATPDSIYFEFSYYDKYGDLVRKIKTYGHRKTGWEFPEYDDDM